MAKSDSEKFKEMGKFIVEFSNTKRTEKAIKILIEYIRSYFSFNESFVKKTMKNIPFISDKCKGLDQKQLDLFRLLYKRYYDLNRLIYYIDIGKYSGEVTISDDGPLIEVDEVKEDEFGLATVGKPIPIRLEKLESYLDLNQIGKPTIKEYLNMLDKNKKNICKLLEKMEEKDGECVRDIFKENMSIISDYSRIEKFRVEIKRMLRALSNGEKLFDFHWFITQLALWEVEPLSHPKLFISETGCVFESIPFEEESYFTLGKVERTSIPNDERMKGQPIDLTKNWEYYFVLLPLRYFLISYFKRDGAILFIKTCDFCNKLYFSNGNKKQRFCPGNKCRLSFHNKKRIESGEHARYKRERKAKGMPPVSYY